MPSPDYHFSYTLYVTHSSSVIFGVTLATSLLLAMTLQQLFNRIFPPIR